MNTFSLPHPHRFYCGTTRTGKTTKFIKDFSECRFGGFYINYTRISTPLIKVDGNCDIGVMIDAVRRGDKLAYTPSRDIPRARKEIAYLIHKLFQACDRKVFTEERPFVFALDECHLLAPEGEGNKDVELIATSGGSSGFKGVFITQKPSMVKKVLISQSDIHVVFTVSDYERRYFIDKGMDFDTMQGMVRNPDWNNISHKYCVWSNGYLQGPFEEKI